MQQCVKLFQLCRSSRWQDKGNSLRWGLVFVLDTREISFPGKGGQPCPKWLKCPSQQHSCGTCTGVEAGGCCYPSLLAKGNSRAEVGGDEEGLVTDAWF